MKLRFCGGCGGGLFFLLVYFEIIAITIVIANKNEDELEGRNAVFDISKTTNWVAASNVVGFTLTLLASQAIIASGWLIFGSLWFLIVTMSEEGSSLRQSAMVFETALKPQFVIENVFRCAAVVTFLGLAMFVKATLTIGLHETMHYFTKTTMADATNIVTNENFVTVTLIRAFANGFFLLVGWTIVALIFGRRIFSNPVVKRKRKKRHATIDDYLPSPNLSDEFKIRQAFYKMLNKM